LHLCGDLVVWLGNNLLDWNAIERISQAAERIYLRHTTIIGFFESE
jgi:hypothetical protein